MNWVSESLIDLIGMSDETTVAYLVAMAKDSSSLPQLQQKMFQDDLLPAHNPGTKTFLDKLYNIFGKKPEVKKPAAQTATPD